MLYFPLQHFPHGPEQMQQHVLETPLAKCDPLSEAEMRADFPASSSPSSTFHEQ